MKQCIPLMRKYGKQEGPIQELTAKLKLEEQKEVTFKEFREKKLELEMLKTK